MSSLSFKRIDLEEFVLFDLLLLDVKFVFTRVSLLLFEVDVVTLALVLELP